jgi:hypothetical protein
MSAMNTSLAAFACAALLSSCAWTKPHVLTSTVLLGPGGVAVARIDARGIGRMQMRLDNRGPDAISYEVRDERQLVLDQGELARGSKAFEWRPLEEELQLTLRSLGPRGADVAYRLAGRDRLGITWNLTEAIDR